MTKLFHVYEGKLTYTMAALAILWGVVGLSMGWLEEENALQTIWMGLAVFGIRRAIK